MINNNKSITFKATAISSGIGIGKAYILRQIDLSGLAKNRLIANDITYEYKRCEKAIQVSKNQLKKIIDRIPKHSDNNIKDIFNVHLCLLDETHFFDSIKNIIYKENSNAEYVISNQIQLLEKKFLNANNEITQTKILDIKDVYYRLLRNLLGIEHVRTNPINRLSEPVIYIAEKLLPSDLLLIDHKKIIGLVIEESSMFSHIVIIAKSLKIPTVINISEVCSFIRPNDIVIVDGYSGEIIIRPPKTDINKYYKKQKRYMERKIIRLKKVECKTKDNRKIKVLANVNTVEEVAEAYNFDADGIGLLRTEFYYMSLKKLPSIEEETDFYKKIICLNHNNELTIRLLDLGGDKQLSYLPMPVENNSLLGQNGIRFLLDNPIIFHNHIVSIINVSNLAPINILLPFVSEVDEVVKSIQIINDIIVKYNGNKNNIKIGIMVEIPATALTIELFLPYIDFVSIGTNDLTQYLYASNRQSIQLEKHKKKISPLILSIIKDITLKAKKMKKKVSICGEIASEPFAACLLVGVGINTISVIPQMIAKIKKAINSKYYKDLKNKSKQILKDC